MSARVLTFSVDPSVESHSKIRCYCNALKFLVEGVDPESEGNLTDPMHQVHYQMLLLEIHSGVGIMIKLCMSIARP